MKSVTIQNNTADLFLLVGRPTTNALALPCNENREKRKIFNLKISLFVVKVFVRDFCMSGGNCFIWLQTGEFLP